MQLTSALVKPQIYPLLAPETSLGMDFFSLRDWAYEKHVCVAITDTGESNSKRLLTDLQVLLKQETDSIIYFSGRHTST